MANINSINSNSYSSTQSLYGNKNVLTGLASGMDTETMIQNSVAGYQTKITALQQEQTKIEWKQDGYRELIDQMNGIMQKYSSYTSKTNLSSNAFFTGATTTTAQGANAAAIVASGTPKSSVQINSVTQLATAARYSVAASALNLSGASNLTGTAVSAADTRTVSAIEGSLTLTAGSEKITLDFGANDVYDSAEELTAGINQKLKAQGASVKATLEDGAIKFASTSEEGTAVYLSGASGDFKSRLNVQYASSSTAADRFGFTSIDVSDVSLTEEKPMAEYLSGKTVEVTLNGVTKKFSIGTINEPDLSAHDAHIAELQAQADAMEDGVDKDMLLTQVEAAKADRAKARSADFAAQIGTNLQGALDSTFGAGMVSVSADNGQLSFAVKENTGSSLTVNSEVKELGLNGLTSYFDTSKKLETLLGEDYFKTEDGEGYEKKDLVINGVTVGSFGRDNALDEVLNAINGSKAGVKVSFSRLTGEFAFSSTNTGASQEINFGEGLGSRLFTAEDGSATYTAGTDAILSATVNGKELSLQRASNTFDMDGMTVTLKQTFTEGEAVTFKTNSDSDKVVDAVKSFVEDVNKLMQGVHDAYATMPAEKSASKHTKYEPLTEADKADMSESAIKAYEEKAKQGILFGDTDLSTLYDRLYSTIQASGQTRIDMEAIGLTTTYANGVTTLSLNEEKLRAALEGDPDKVRNVFATTSEDSAGLVGKLKKTMEAYASTSLGSPGILVRKAGTKLSAVSLMNNNLQKQMDNINSQIESWETKLSNKIDYYTRQFTALEKMISSMNNQSSMLADLSGY